MEIFVLRLDILIYLAICPASNCMELINNVEPLIGAAELVDIIFPSENVNGIELTNERFCGEQKTVEKLLTDNLALFCISP
jgi:hypothetical protein